MPGKVRYNQLSDFEKKKFLGEFYTMISLLRNRGEVKTFFKDLLTLSEVVMISRRIQAAKMLLEGETYEEISKRLKMSTTTVNSVEKWLSNGFGGYKNIIKRYKNKKEYKFEEKNYASFSLPAIRKKYPLHFLLINLLSKK
ncbi:MAG: YerC/YecD family TrpR-related protein [Patescibacteria group bacterium]|nr:YerC/YecD family TrpR-related protein [Patescibacteria group bacterium]